MLKMLCCTFFNLLNRLLAQMLYVRILLVKDHRNLFDRVVLRFWIGNIR